MKYLPDLNLYRYVGNNPYRWIDPLGLAVYTIVVETEIRKPDPQSGTKSYQEVSIDTDAGTATSTYSTGKTTVGGRQYSSRSDDFTVSQVSGDNGVYTAAIDGTTGSKWFPANIDYSFDVVINENTGEVFLVGSHDGYPSYMIRLNGELIYDYQQDDIWDLFGDADDVDVNLKKGCK